MKNQKLLYGFGGTVLGCLAGVVGMSLVNPTPQQAAEERQPPELPTTTAQVKLQQLTETITGQCETTIPTTSVKPPSLSAPRLVVTGAPPAAGSQIATGTRLVDVSGTPMIAYLTTMPFYRDLSPGVSGPDVLALEQQLVASGLLSEADDTYASDTAAVIGSLNAAAGLVSNEVHVASAVAVPPGSVVDQVKVGIGQQVSADTELLTLAGPANRASCLIPQGTPVSVGQEVAATTGAAEVALRVAAVAPDPDQAGMLRVAVETVDPATLAGATTITVVSAQTDGEVLTVPALALRTSASGETVVRRAGTEVSVVVGMSAGGWVEVTSSELSDGDAVEVAAQ